MRTRSVVALGLALALLVALVAYATRWQMTEFRAGNLTIPVRVNRYTGRAERLSPYTGEWITATTAHPAARPTTTTPGRRPVTALDSLAVKRGIPLDP